MTTKPRYDDPDALKEAKHNEKLADLQFKEDVKTLMALPAFRRFIWFILNICHVFQTSFTGNSQTFFNEGERNIGLRVFLAVQEHAPGGYADMVKENSKGKTDD